MHDISLKPLGDSIQGGRLLLEGTAKTYRYLDDEEILAVDKAAGAKRK
jgi:type IV pilus assembly protein PilO